MTCGLVKNQQKLIAIQSVIASHLLQSVCEKLIDSNLN